MNNTLILSDTNPKTTLDRSLEAIAPQVSYFDIITQKTDSWHTKQQAIKEQRAQLVNTLLVRDTDTLTGTTRTFRITTELLATEQVDALELPELALTESEVLEYAN